MKFLIERASDLGENKPCKEATLLNFGKGQIWEIEVGSMEKLLSMVDLGCSGIVIDRSPYKALPEYKYKITIYDDYLE